MCMRFAIPNSWSRCFLLWTVNVISMSFLDLVVANFGESLFVSPPHYSSLYENWTIGEAEKALCKFLLNLTLQYNVTLYSHELHLVRLIKIKIWCHSLRTKYFYACDHSSPRHSCKVSWRAGIYENPHDKDREMSRGEDETGSESYN